MTNFIPIFPLNLVLFPGEKLNLHVFEPRYKQLIKECVLENKPFGIPAVVEKAPLELGTLTRVKEVVQEYDNGELDIRTEGESVFRVLTVVKEVPDKLYSGAIVSYPQNSMERNDSRIAAVIYQEVRRLYTLMNVEDKLPKDKPEITSYDIAHFVGLSLRQEYDLLGLFSETERLEYLRRHLKELAPIVQELETMKERIKRNGHFRDLSLRDFNL
jgi:hypothetical protein